MTAAGQDNWLVETPTRRVLVVDDEAVIVMAATYILEYAGYEVYTASNGRDALNLLRTSVVDTVLLDLQMPIMDGPEFLRAYYTDHQHSGGVRIVVMSADDRSRRKVLKMGAHAFVQKPFLVAELLHAVRGAGGASRDSGRATLRDVMRP
jgi:two-component system OmpR family response regulator